MKIKFNIKFKLFVSVITIAIFSMFLNSSFEKKVMNNCHFYTLGIPIYASSYSLYFQIFPEYKTYNYHKGFFDLIGSNDRVVSLKMTDKFIVKVNCKNYNYSEICWDVPLTDSTKFISQHKWKTTPF